MEKYKNHGTLSKTSQSVRRVWSGSAQRLRQLGPRWVNGLVTHDSGPTWGWSQMVVFMEGWSVIVVVLLCYSVREFGD